MANCKMLCWVLSLGPLVAVCPASRGAQGRTGVRRTRLDRGQETHIVRFLFPLPHDCRIGDFAFSVDPSACSLAADPHLTPREKMFVEDFRERWRKRYDQVLSADRRRSGLTIVVGRARTHPLLRQAVRKGLLDPKHLAGRPNAEQAYAIACVEDARGVTAYLAANESPGLYYALATFEQLLKGLEKKPSVTVPLARIVDWPDIKRRGIWGCSGRPCFSREAEDQFLHYAGMKLNVYWGPHIYMRVSKDKKISYHVGPEVFAPAQRCNVRMVPTLPHLDYLLSGNYAVGKHFPEVAGKPGKKPFGGAKPWCFANPRSREVLDQIFEAIARGVASDRIWVWPSEHSGACHCEVCRGDRRRQVVNEIKHIMHAYTKAKAIKPALKMSLITSQGTYPHNMAMLEHIPTEVGLDIYGGSGRCKTYKTWLGEYLLTPSVREMRRRGYRLGALPMLSPSHMPSCLLFPFNTPFLAKLRASELRDYGLENMILWMPPVTAMGFNLQAAAEFSWNTGGRTPEEFAVSWATRRGMLKPELAAKIACMLEYPARALSAGMRGGTMMRPAKRVVSAVLGEKPEWGTYFSVPKAFEYSTHEEFARVLKRCEAAIRLSENLGDREFIAGARLLRQWVAIFERYTFFLENKDRTGAAKTEAEEIVRLTDELPRLWEQWIDTQPIEKAERKKRRSHLDRLLKEFERLKEAR